MAVSFGACLGHGPPDNSGHKRHLTDTSALPFTWGNARCQQLPLDWFFPDTEAVMGAAPGHHCRDR
jgi:hypothetical protein